MKILEYSNKDLGRAFKRISYAFTTYFPDVEWVSLDPDLEIVQVVGKLEYEYLRSKSSLKNVVMFQQCVLTSGISIDDWVKLWKECRLVISFHDLQSYTSESFNFLRTPLGAEPSTFSQGKAQRYYTVFATGHVAQPECLDKIFDSCVLSNKKMFHTGEDFKWDPNHYQFIEYMTDSVYVSTLQKVKYVTGLRLYEGFEMHCIEGAMTGATPIVLDLPTYSFYKDIALFINPHGNITKQLTDIFLKPYIPLTPEQVSYARNEFSWEKICNTIYKRLIDA